MTATAEPSSDESLRQVLADTRTIAVVGIKDDAAEDAQRVPRYMQAHDRKRCGCSSASFTAALQRSCATPALL